MRKLSVVFVFFLIFTSNVSAKGFYECRQKDHHNHHHHNHHQKSQASVTDFLGSQQKPFAIGHRGFGNNLGENPDKPIENTIESINKAFEYGVNIVEVDASITLDGKAVVLHDDYLEDFSCINTMTYNELIEKNSVVPTLEKVLKTARHYSQNGHSSKYKAHATRHHKSNGGGYVIIEIKTPSPLCDPQDETENALVQSVIDAIRKSRMAENVIIESFSPALLKIAADLAPEIPRNITMTAAQFLTAEQVEALTGLKVALIDKDAGYGLQWAQTGSIYRLPGYESLEQYFSTVVLTGASVVALDFVFLAQVEQNQPGAASAIINQLKTLGVYVTGYTVENSEQWQLLEDWGVDGVFTNDIPMGVELQGEG